MLAPRHPAALDREAALRLLTELQRLLNRDRRMGQLLEQVRYRTKSAVLRRVHAAPSA